MKHSSVPSAAAPVCFPVSGSSYGCVFASVTQKMFNKIWTSTALEWQHICGYYVSENSKWLSPLGTGVLMKCYHAVQRSDESPTAPCSWTQIQCRRCTCRASLCSNSRCITGCFLTAVMCNWQETARFSPSASPSTTTHQCDPTLRWCRRRRNRVRRLPLRWSRTAPSPAPRTPSVGQQKSINTWQIGSSIFSLRAWMTYLGIWN